MGGMLLIIGALTPLAVLGSRAQCFPRQFLVQRREPFINPAGHTWENSDFYLIAGILPGSERRRSVVAGFMAVRQAEQSPSLEVSSAARISKRIDAV
jgi:hypothetical protein